MRKRQAITVIAVVSVAISAGWVLKQKDSGPGMTKAASGFLETLDEKETSIALKEYGSPERVGWHFIPKESRKGLQVRDMNKVQRKAALKLLKSSLSAVGYDKSIKIMELEKMLHAMEAEAGKKGGHIRDHLRYYITIFGKPTETGRWGLSMEGHHLSLNFVVEENRVISSTPSFFAANPATVMGDVPKNVKRGIAKGSRVLADEEQLAFDLVTSLSADQKQKAILADKAPAEIRDPGSAQPPQGKAEGIPAAELDEKQANILESLIKSYANNMASDVAEERLSKISKAGFDKIHFAWAGPTKPGIGHYYRVQGPTFLIEFVNTQPDPAGNLANHIHCVWRDPAGDFAIPLAKND